MLNINFFKYNTMLGFISDLLILFLFPFAVFCRNIYPDIYYIIIFILLLFVNLSLYIKLYTWRNLPLSLPSFIFFFLNIMQMILYIFAISMLFNMLYGNNYMPIYLDNLSVSSKYRYLFLSSICVISTIFYILAYLFKLNIQPYISVLTFPYLQEEFRCFIDTWKNAYIGKILLGFINNLVISNSYRYLYYFLDLLSQLFRIIMVLFFLSFCFFGSNFDYLLYCSPIAFFFWLLNFFIYNINWIIEGNSTVIRECLVLSPIDSNLLPSNKTGFSFKVTPQAIKEGFTENDLDFLVVQWLELGNLVAFLQYRRYFKYFSFVIVSLYFISWCYISFYFFYLPVETTSVGFGTFLRKSFLWHPPLRSPRDSRRLFECYQNTLKVMSNNEFAVGHPVYGELLSDGTYRIDGFLTRSPKYGTNILNTPMVTGKTGNNQNAVPFLEPLIVPAYYVTPAIDGSMAILEAPGVKAILDHIQPKQ